MPVGACTRLAFVWIALSSCQGGASAQQPRLPLSKLGVDMISVQGGHRLLGAFLGKTKDSISFAVERQWLKRANSKLYEKLSAAEGQKRTEAKTAMIQRLESWKRRRADDMELTRHIDKKLSKWRGEDQKADVPESQFMRLQFKPSQVKRQFSQPGNRKQVVLLAWQRRLKDVTTRSVNSLSRELRELKATAANTRIDLGKRLPRWGIDDRQWAAQVAFVEYRLRQPLNYEGTKDFLVQTGEKAKPADLEKIFTRMLTDELKNKVAQLLEKPAAPANDEAWKKTAIAGARKAKVSGVRVARLRQNVTTGNIDVNVAFLAEMPGGKWEVVYDDTVNSQAAKQDEQRQKRVAVAPEVEKVLRIAKAAGLNPDDKKIRLALQHGAATKQAYSQAMRRFEDHLTEVINPK